MTADALAIVNQLLPASEGTDAPLRTGKESTSAVSPSDATESWK
jgi:hypothetical protein